jgi:hypothetical protein
MACQFRAAGLAVWVWHRLRSLRDMRITSKRLGPFIIWAKVDRETLYVEIYDGEITVTTLENNATAFKTMYDVDKAIMRLRFEFPNVEWNVRGLPFRIFAVAG